MHRRERLRGDSRWKKEEEGEKKKKKEKKKRKRKRKIKNVGSRVILLSWVCHRLLTRSSDRIPPSVVHLSRPSSSSLLLTALHPRLVEDEVQQHYVPIGRRI